MTPGRRRERVLAGSRVLITGAGSGLGRRLALAACERGAQVTIWDLDGAAGAAVAAEILAAGGRARAQQVDVTDVAAVSDAAAQAGAMDIVINNAGIVTGKPLMAATEEEIRRTFEVNTLALYWVTRAFLPGMIERDRGRLVTIASAGGLVGVARQTDYSASKWAAVGFTEAVRSELRSTGSTVGTLTVCPFYIDTGMFDGAGSRFPRLLPVLKEGEVAERVLDALERGRTQLLLPPLVRTLPLARALPQRLFDRVLDVLGVSSSMAGFTGRR